MHRFLVIAGALFFASEALAQADGYFGFSQQVSVNWRLNVESAVVNYVAPNSPAQAAGIAVGDAVTDIEGCVVPGCGAYKAKDLMEKKIGEILNLKLKRPNGQEYTASIKATQRPAQEPKP
ncbi:MAG TPA: PDZ domain-containing protein [Nevskiaceae bacterium]|nr:PDZ domain-containing protein [Nevskiaceae bacterium]